MNLMPCKTEMNPSFPPDNHIPVSIVPGVTRGTASVIGSLHVTTALPHFAYCLCKQLFHTLDLSQKSVSMDSSIDKIHIFKGMHATLCSTTSIRIHVPSTTAALM